MTEKTALSFRFDFAKFCLVTRVLGHPYFSLCKVCSFLLYCLHKNITLNQFGREMEMH